MYDKTSETLWVEFPDADGDTLLTADDTAVYTQALLAGTWHDLPLRAVNFVFHNADAAAYNSDSLAFVRIGTWLAGPPRRRFGAEAPEFDVREDGISLAGE